MKCILLELLIMFVFVVDGKDNVSIVTVSYYFFTPQPVSAVKVSFLPMVSGWAGSEKSLSGLYLRNCKV